MITADRLTIFRSPKRVVFRSEPVDLIQATATVFFLRFGGGMFCAA